jgi:kynurenine formamidase
MTKYRGTFIAVIVGMAMAVGLSAQTKPATSHTTTKADLERWSKEYSNWGRWGKDDEIGTLNLITPAKRKQAAALVRDGVSISMSRTLETVKAADVSSPFEFQMRGIASDSFSINYHGYAHTHLDGLSHRFNAEGVGYNYYKPDPEQVKQENGHPKNSIINVKNGIFTRGILIDLPRLKGVPYLEPGTAIYAEDLEAWEKMAGIKISPGDAIFLYVGRWVRRDKVGPWNINSANGESAGLHASVIPWLRQRDVAIVGSEAAMSVAPGGETPSAPHDFMLTYLGGFVLDNCDLTALSAAAASRKRWEFLLTVAPWAIRGGTGSPVNPIATF